MLSESDDEEAYTVHKVKEAVDAAQAVEIAPQQQVTVEVGDTSEEAPATTSSSSSSPPLARYYRLGTEERHAFDEHMRQLRAEMQKSQREREFREQHPFRPLRHVSTVAATAPTTAAAEGPIAQSEESPTAATAPSAASPAASPVGLVFNRLAAQAVQLELRRRHREEQRRRSEAAALRDAFQPAINHRPPQHADPLESNGNIPVEERLLHYGATVARERQRRQEQKAVEERAALEAAQAAVVGGGAASRLADPAERRRQRDEFEQRSARFVEARAVHRQQAQVEAAAAHSFQPHISATSVALDEARQRETQQTRRAELQSLLTQSADEASFGVGVRSYSTGRDTSRRSDALYAQAVARQRQQTDVRSGDVSTTAGAEASALSHQPLTNPNSALWIASGPHRHFFEQGFVRRQSLYEQVRTEEATLKAAAASSSSFQQGGDTTTSGGGTVTSPRRAPVSTKALNERLYYGARKAEEVAQRRRAVSLDARACPFRPALAPGTASVLQRMKETRDVDVVRRLTDTSKPRAVPHPEKQELYARAPLKQRARSTTNTTTTRTDAAAVSSSHAASASPAVEEVVEQQEEAVAAPPSASPPPRRVVVSRDQIEHFYQRQLNFLQERQDLIQERREGEAVQELVECTFRPRTNADRRGGGAAAAEVAPTTRQQPTATDSDGVPSVSRVTGVSGFLERQKVARQRKAEHDERVRTMGLPRTTGCTSTTTTTLLSPFTLQTSQRRRRSSCSPAGAESDGGEFGLAPAVWRNALTSSERALYDALSETAQYPAVATGPLFPLPGYAGSPMEEGGDEDAVYFDEVEEDYRGNGNVGGAEGGASLPHPSTLQVRPTRRGEAPVARMAEGHGDRVSLFSSLAPNTFTGRSLATRSPHHPGKQSALKKTTAAELTASALRHKERRTVSFLEDGSPAPPLRGRP